MAAPMLLLRLMAALLASSAARPPSNNASAAPTVHVRLGVMLPERDLRVPWALPHVAAALRLALEALQPQLSLDGLAVHTAFASTEEEEAEGIFWCYAIATFLKAAELKGCHDLDVLLGLSCLSPGSSGESFAEYWPLPLLRAGLYSRFGSLPGEVYAGPLGPSLVAFQTRLLQHFNWNARVLMADSSAMDCWPYHELFADALDGQLTPGRPPTYFRVIVNNEPGEVIRDIQAEGRDTSLACLLVNLLSCLEAVPATWSSLEHFLYLQTVLVITPHEPQTTEYRGFENELVLRAQRDFGVPINDSLGHLVAGCFHDGLLLYLRALNETLREGGTKRNTSRILEKMRSLKFQGVTGMVSINSKNDREMDFDLWAMKDMDNGEFQVVGHYIASEERMNWMGDILWKKGGPPHDNPPCVFDQDDSSCGNTTLVMHSSSDQDTGQIQICQWSTGNDNLVN